LVNPQVAFVWHRRELWREHRESGSTVQNCGGLESRCASDWRTESSNLPPSVPAGSRPDRSGGYPVAYSGRSSSGCCWRSSGCSATLI
jgi:hypothetical protein